MARQPEEYFDHFQVCLVNDPRNPYNKLLTVEYLSNMVNGRLVLYNNQPVDALKRLAAASLRDNEVRIFLVFNGAFSPVVQRSPGVMLIQFLPTFHFLQAVWFGCDVGKHFERKSGALHLDM